MFENLLKLVTENAGEAIINNPAIPNEKNDAAISTATTGIMSQLQNMVGEGGISGITSMFQGGNVQDHSQVSNISQNVAGSLMEKFGINSQQAGDIVSKLIPTVMSQFVSKTNDPKDNSFDIQDIIKNLGSGGAGGLMDKVKGFF